MKTLAGVLFSFVLSLNSFAQSSFEIKTQEDLRLYTVRQTSEYLYTAKLCQNLNPEILSKNPLNIRDMNEFKEVIQTSTKMNLAYQELFYSRFKTGFSYGMSLGFFKDFLSVNDEVSSLTKELISSAGFEQAMNECFGKNQLPLHSHVFMLSIVMADVLGQTSSVVTASAVFKGVNYLRLAVAAKFGKAASHLSVTAPIVASPAYDTYDSVKNMNQNIVKALTEDTNQNAQSHETNQKAQLHKLKELLEAQKRAANINPDLIARLEARILKLENK